MTALRNILRAAWPKADQLPPADPALLAAANRALYDQLLVSRVATKTLLREMASAYQTKTVASALSALRRLHGIEDEDLIENQQRETR